MTDQVQTVRKERLREVIRWINDSGETVPAYGVVEVVSYDTATQVYTIQKPSADGQLYFINGPVTVANGKLGTSGVCHVPQQVLIPGGEAVGDSLGPVEDEWYMEEGSGFQLVSNITSGVGAVICKGSGGGGGGERLYFTIMAIDCVTEDNPGGSNLWYVNPTYYSVKNGCGSIPHTVNDPYSDFDGLVEVHPPLCDIGGANFLAKDLIRKTAEADLMFPVDDCGNSLWIAKDPCVDDGAC